MTSIINAASGGVTFTGGTTAELAIQAGGSTAAAFNTNGLFFRNRIINGDMRIDQRNAGASGTAVGYTVDRWGYYASQASKGTWQQNAGSVTPPTGFTNYLGFTSSSAYSVLATDQFFLYQRIEGLNIADLGWGAAGALTVTLSFWVRSSLTGTFGGVITNSAGNRTYPFSFTINSANTWEYETVTIAGDTTGTWLTTNGTGINLYFNLGTGTTYSATAGSWTGTSFISAPTGATSVVGTNGATFYVTGVQLETGSTATPFERRPFGTELMLCQRYYEKSYGLAITPGTGLGTGFSGMTTSSAATAEASSGITFRVSKRADPNMTIYNAVTGSSGSVYRISDAASVTVSSVNYIGQNQVGNIILASGSQNTYYYHWVASIEL